MSREAVEELAGTFVFGYGSLLRGDDAVAQYRVECSLQDHVRLWNVAMDNRLDLPGYKYYLDRATGERPPVFVTFLNVEPRAGSAVNGLAIRVADAELELYDERERNYERREVTSLMSEAFSGRVWTYIGRPDAVERYELGVREGSATVSRDYLENVLTGFASISAGALERFHASTVPPAVPQAALEVVRLEGSRAQASG